MALLDPFYRAFGSPTPIEAAEAARDRMHVERSGEPRDRFATAVADAMSAMPRDQARKAFQGLRDVSLSGNEDVRWMQTADAARRMADEHVARPEQSLDASLSRAVGQRALLEAAENVNEKARYRFEPGERIESILASRQELVARQTRAFMSTGSAAQHNARIQANDMIYNGDQTASHSLRHDVGDVVGNPTAATRREWAMKATEARLAAAQAGILSAPRTVEAAMDASRQGHMVEGRIAQTPDRARTERLQGAERVTAIEAQVARNNAPMPSMRQHMLSTEEQLARHGIAASAPREGPTLMDRASIARSMSDSVRTR